MGQIKNRDEINHKLLNDFFKNRNKGYENKGLIKHLNDIFEGNIKDEEVYQCSCGQITVIKKTLADEIKSKIQSDEIPCKNCGLNDFISGNIKSFDFIKINNFQKILSLIDKESESKNKDFDKLMIEILKLDNSFEANSPHELFYKIHRENTMSYFYTQDLDKNILKILRNIFTDAIKNRIEFENLLKENKLDSTSEKNTFKEFIKLEHYKFLKEKDKLENKFQSFDIESEYNVKEKELEVSSQLNIYNHLVEEKNLLEILINLVRISNNLKFELKPFKRERLTHFDQKTQTEKKRKINCLKGMIECFGNYTNANALKIILEYIYKNQLRNSHAHNGYKILLEGNLINFKTSISFEDFNKLLNDFEKIKNYTYILLQEYFFKFNPIIKLVSLTYEDIIHKEGGKIEPKDNSTLPVLSIMGYEFNEDNLHKIEIKVHDTFFEIKNNYFSNFYKFEDKEVKMWLKQSLDNEGNFILSIFNNERDKENSYNIIPEKSIFRKYKFTNEDFEKVKNIV